MRFKLILAAMVVTGQMAVLPSARAAAWSEPLTITQAFVEDSDNIVIYTSGGAQSTPGCVVNTWIFVATTEDRRARAWATILSAQMGGKKIKFWVNDTCASWDYHKATAVMLLTAP